MDLAHVEYYFADLLSVMEAGREPETGLTREGLRLDCPEDAEGELPPAQLRLPPNLYVIGTVNMDETTYAFSPKVLDRAFTIEFTEVDLERYRHSLDAVTTDGLAPEERESLAQGFTFGGRFARVEKGAVRQCLQEDPALIGLLADLNSRLQPYSMHFGYRVFDEIAAFLCAAQANDLFTGGEGEAQVGTALDAAVLMKVLPKFHGARSRLEKPLEALLGWCAEDGDGGAVQAAMRTVRDPQGRDEGKTVAMVFEEENVSWRYARTAERAVRMMQALVVEGFASFG